MKVRRIFPLLLVLLLATTFATTQPSSAVAPDQGASAFGQGEFFNRFHNEDWSFAFDVTANKNGQARGRATFDILHNATQTHVVVRINCLDVQGSSGLATAVMTGFVLHSDDPNFPKRAKVIFAADDNSAFPTIRPDLITPLFVFPFEGDCHDTAPLTILEVSPDAITIEL